MFGILMGNECLLKSIKHNNIKNTTAIFDSYPLTQNDVEVLAKALFENTHLKILSLLDCHFTTEQIALLVPTIKQHHGLTDVVIEPHDDYPLELQKNLQEIGIQTKNAKNLDTNSKQEPS